MLLDTDALRCTRRILSTPQWRTSNRFQFGFRLGKSELSLVSEPALLVSGQTHSSRISILQI